MYVICQAHNLSSYSSDWILGYQNNGLWFRTMTIDGGNQLGDGDWHHFGFTFDGTDAKLYIDGSQQGGDAASGFVSGSLDEVCIFSRALSQEEINASYNSKVNQLYHNFTGLSVGNYSYYAHAIDTAGNENTTETRYVEKIIETSVDKISPYEVTSSPLTINATGDSCLDNVTLYYRYSSDNASWVDPPIGVIADAVVDSWEWDAEEGKVLNPTALLKLGNSEYYVTSAYGDTGNDNDGFLRTMKVWNDNGTFVKTLVDTWEYDTSDGGYAGITHISGDIYAVIYFDGGSAKGKVITTRIWESNGTLQKTIIDTLNLVTTAQLYPSLIHVTGNVYAAVYKQQGYGHDHQLETIEINTTGTITDTRLDLVEFDDTSTSSGETIGITSAVMVDSDTIAIVWQETVNADGWLVTYNISAAGDITNTYADIWEFNQTLAAYPFIYYIAGNVFAITYVDTDSDGWTNTVTIDDDGNITKTWIDTLEWGNADTVVYPSMFTVADAVDNSPGVYGITYRKSDWKGRVYTFNISSDGTIGDAVIDSLQFSSGYNYYYAPCVHVSGNYYLIVYQGTDVDGWANTVEIQTEAGWMQWDDVSNPDESGPTWSWEFNFPNGTGYYEFYSIGKKSGSVDETAPDSADAICHWSENTSFNVTPSEWNQGPVNIGDTNETIGFYFNLANEGNVALDITINATNATNTTTPARWNLTSTPSHNNFSLQYNKSGGGSWIPINITFDTFTSLAIGGYQTFDLKLLMATTSSTVDPMEVTVTFKSVAS